MSKYTQKYIFKKSEKEKNHVRKIEAAGTFELEFSS